jgi:hypothetical protein
VARHSEAHMQLSVLAGNRLRTATASVEHGLKRQICPVKHTPVGENRRLENYCGELLWTPEVARLALGTGFVPR